MHQVSMVCCVFSSFCSRSHSLATTAVAAMVATHLTFYAYVYFTFWTFVNSEHIGTFVCARPSISSREKKLFDSRSQAVQILRFVSLSAFLLNKLNVHSEVTFKQLMRLSSYNRDRTTTTATEKRVEYFI